MLTVAFLLSMAGFGIALICGLFRHLNVSVRVMSVAPQQPRGVRRLLGFVRQAESRASGLNVEPVLVSQLRLSE